MGFNSGSKGLIQGCVGAGGCRFGQTGALKFRTDERRSDQVAGPVCPNCYIVSARQYEEITIIL